MTTKGITLGVEGLSELIGVVESPYVLLVAGNPGAGKTTLASTICYKNALSGKRCLYITFYEQKEKLFKYMSNLGLDLADAESKGLLRFTRLSIPSSIDAFIEVFTSLLSEERYDVIVIDSINPLLESFGPQSGRAWLTNFFYNIAQTIQGFLILVSELPHGSETTASGVLEFITDAIVVLKQKIEDRFLVRFMEIRKARGSSISLAEVPFSINAGEGIRVWVPSVLSEVSPEREPVELVCDLLRKAWGNIRKGQVINIFYPPDCRHPAMAFPILLPALISRLKTLVISYRYSPQTLEDTLLASLISRGVGTDNIRNLLRKYVKVVSINPFSYSTSQLAIKEMELINSESPDVVIFHGPEIARAASDLNTYVRELFNETNYLKNRGILVARLISYIDETTYRLESSMADIVMKLDYEVLNGKPVLTVYLWSKGGDPHIVSLNELEKCVLEAYATIKVADNSSQSPGRA
ncbi:MAG: ATPase domain-containing protein [Sulfolobales archaeon]